MKRSSRPRRGKGRTSAAVAVTLLTVATSASGAAPNVAANLRSGNHPDFGRVVIDADGKTSFVLDQDGDHAMVHLPQGATLGPAPAAPRNVISLSTSGDTLELLLRHGAKLNARRMDGRIVLDAFDPAVETGNEAHALPRQEPHKEVPRRLLSMAASPETGGRTIQPTEASQAVAGPAPQPPPVPEPALAMPEIARRSPPGRDTLPEDEGPIGLRARRVKLPKDVEGTAFLVPFDTTTSAAAFESGNATTIVFDERRPVDMAALAEDPMFGAASVRLLPTGTVFRIPHPPGMSIVLAPSSRGWRVTALPATPKLQPIDIASADGRLNFAAEQPGEIVPIADPETGATLLVGTQHRPGQGVPSARATPEFILRPTSQGVVAEPLSDAIALRQAPGGFTLSGGPAGLALSPATGLTAALMDAAHLTSRLHLSTMPREALLRLSTRQLAEAAAAPPQARGPKHRAAAESFLALGMAAEAESLLRLAAEQDPKEAASIDAQALMAIAALLAGRPEEANGLADPKLDGTDDIALWRAIRLAMRDEGSPAAAAAMAAAAPLVFQFPEPIRDHILPLINETMIQGGEIEAAARLLALSKDNPRLGYARALMRQAEGDNGQALTMLDALAVGHDQFDRARAAVRAVELRLASGALDKAQAAQALDKLLYAWRGDARELALRERVANLRAETGAWRQALATLRQAEIDFPDQTVSIHHQLKGFLGGMIHDPEAERSPPLEFIAAVEENADLLDDTGADQGADAPLADRLLALDLPGRAKPLLEKLLKQAKSDIAKARFGASLAMLDVREGDDPGALAVLDVSQAADLPADLAEQRLILRAETIARRGEPQAGAALLTSASGPKAIEARARIQESAGDWTAAARTWTERAAQFDPGSGVLDATQAEAVLRLATATARAGDDSGLATLRERFGSRIGSGPLADMFRLLTAEPVRTAADIRRSQTEMNLAASVPANLKALQPSTVSR